MRVFKVILFSVFLTTIAFSVFNTNTATAATSCSKNSSFFGLPVWYKYLPYRPYDYDDPDNNVQVHECRVEINVKQNPEHLALIGFGIIDILLRLTALVAFGYLVYGGVQYLISQGEPDRTKSAKSTIINAVIGIAVTIVAASVVTFVAGRIA